MARVLVVGANGGTKILNSCSYTFKQLGCKAMEYDYYDRFLDKRHVYFPFLGDITEKINYFSINEELIMGFTPLTNYIS